MLRNELKNENKKLKDLLQNTIDKLGRFNDGDLDLHTIKLELATALHQTKSNDANLY